jgi:hypothetical protein
VKAIENYYFKQMLIPAERRKSSIPVNQNRRKQDDRRRKENVTCAGKKTRFIQATARFNSILVGKIPIQKVKLSDTSPWGG